MSIRLLRGNRLGICLSSASRLAAQSCEPWLQERLEHGNFKMAAGFTRLEKDDGKCSFTDHKEKIQQSCRLDQIQLATSLTTWANMSLCFLTCFYLTAPLHPSSFLPTLFNVLILLVPHPCQVVGRRYVISGYPRSFLSFATFKKQLSACMAPLPLLLLQRNPVCVY